MKYLVACNWDLDLLDQIDRPEVVAVFAGLPNTLISSGRPSSQIRPVPESHVRNYIKLVHDKKWSFDFNLNSPCLANKEVTQGGFKEIMKYLEWASDLVDRSGVLHGADHGLAEDLLDLRRARPPGARARVPVSRYPAGSALRGHGRRHDHAF